MTFEAHGKSCIACGLTGEGMVTFHHVHTRGSGGTNHENNLMPLCFKHHEQIHRYALSKFVGIFPSVKNWLLYHGWHINGFGKWRGPSECYSTFKVSANKEQDDA